MKNTVELDVRPILAAKKEPFQDIMAAVESLNDDDIFVLHAPFKPAPLLRVMKGKGYDNCVKQIDSEHWMVEFTKFDDDSNDQLNGNGVAKDRATDKEDDVS